MNYHLWPMPQFGALEMGRFQFASSTTKQGLGWRVKACYGDPKSS